MPRCISDPHSGTCDLPMTFSDIHRSVLHSREILRYKGHENAGKHLPLAKAVLIQLMDVLQSLNPARAQSQNQFSILYLCMEPCQHHRVIIACLPTAGVLGSVYLTATQALRPGDNSPFWKFATSALESTLCYLCGTKNP